MKGSSPYKTVGLGLPLRMTSALSNFLVKQRNYEAPPTDPVATFHGPVSYQALITSLLMQGHVTEHSLFT